MIRESLREGHARLMRTVRKIITVLAKMCGQGTDIGTDKMMSDVRGIIDVPRTLEKGGEGMIHHSRLSEPVLCLCRTCISSS